MKKNSPKTISTGRTALPALALAAILILNTACLAIATSACAAAPQNGTGAASADSGKLQAGSSDGQALTSSGQDNNSSPNSSSDKNNSSGLNNSPHNNSGSDRDTDKSETVYVKADAQGKVQDITVETVLKNSGGTQPLADYSTLTQIKNTEGDEEFRQAAGGTLFWDNHGEDIRYEGKGSEPLPVTVTVTYYLNGRQLTPEQLAGQSGQLRIRFDYENHSSETVEVRDKPQEIPVPFTVFTALFLPSDHFSDIQVSDGKILTMDDQNIVLGYACPGLADSLRLTDYEPTEEIRTPDYVEVTATVTDFQLDFTATIVTTGLFQELDQEDLNELDDLSDAMEELTDASGKLADGTAELFNGIKTYQTYLDEYIQGVSTVNDGATALKDGIAALNANKGALAEGALALAGGLDSLYSALSQIMAALPANSSTSDSGTSAIPGGMDTAAAAQAAAALENDARLLAAALQAVQEGLAQLDTYPDQASKLAQRQAMEALQASLDHENLERMLAESLGDAWTSLSDEDRLPLRTALQTSLLKELESDIRNTVEFPSLTLDMNTEGITEVLKDMELQLQILGACSQVLSDMGDSLFALDTALSALQEGAGQLRDGSRQLSDGISAFNQGIRQLYDGSTALCDGSSQLTEAGSALQDSLKALAEGMCALKEGTETFDEEGMDRLEQLAGDDLQDLALRLRALREADCQYTNYGGILDGQTGNVRFIIETEEIK